MTTARNLGLFVIAVMGALMANILVHDGMDHGVGFDVFLAGSGSPWQLFINNDLVTGLLFMCGWVLLRERGGRRMETAAWIWMILWWGNIVVGAYVVRAAWQAQGDWPRFFMGRHAGHLREIAITPAARVIAGLGALGVAMWLAGALIGTQGAAIPAIGYALGFAPVVLSLLVLATPSARR
ncbi:MAG: hypothetical protein RIS94_224 [Pseudomonadota bacterium]|jgi:hypothetical protein